MGQAAMQGPSVPLTMVPSVAGAGTGRAISGPVSTSFASCRTVGKFPGS